MTLFAIDQMISSGTIRVLDPEAVFHPKTWKEVVRLNRAAVACKIEKFVRGMASFKSRDKTVLMYVRILCNLKIISNGSKK